MARKGFRGAGSLMAGGCERYPDELPIAVEEGGGGVMDLGVPGERGGGVTDNGGGDVEGGR